MYVTVKREKELLPEHKRELALVLDQAEQDPFLKGDESVLRHNPSRRAIVWRNEEVVGFFSPEKTSFKGLKCWRPGALYLLPSYRGKGIMEEVLKHFYAEYSPGLAWIDDTNNRSINLFTKLGFVKDKEREFEGKKGHWYFLPKMKSGNESLGSAYTW